MINGLVLINRIKTTSGYTNVNWVQEHISDVVDEAVLPSIKVGYASITPERNENVTYNSYRLGNADLVQTFVIQITCDISTFHEVWNNIFGVYPDGTVKLIGWNAGEDRDNNTAVGYLRGETIGISQGKLKFQSFITVGFPTFIN